MKIEIKKNTNYLCQYTITRHNNTIEQITLETKTYLLHDICHYSVEINLGYSNGFWGMLAQGYPFNNLFGKHNPETAQLRSIEKIVGLVQSIYWGHVSKQDIGQYTAHLEINIQEGTLDTCLQEIKRIMENWEQLKIGEQMKLEWSMKTN